MLPRSQSGQTEDHPDLLKYSCQMECRVRPIKPAMIWSPRTTEPQERSDGKTSSTDSADAQKQSISVLLSRPIFALEFNSLRMHVDAPKIVVPDCKKKLAAAAGGHRCGLLVSSLPQLQTARGSLGVTPRVLVGGVDLVEA
ncbi:hypothetical protein PR202_ga07468 [Eleusine coracana subsp. coracana]|uniref:Uncharacterized protein n=1 Tax=Eleusine coracana subsp. coracana TaxID=191504 RepID=A0AAV5C042_ELECO|nr:hypothetical protein PR202_ga07468 [Eleusine coracana subsp. coracana]